jgi:lytic murein transglycosylase
MLGRWVKVGLAACLASAALFATASARAQTPVQTPAHTAVTPSTYPEATQPAAETFAAFLQAIRNEARPLGVSDEVLTRALDQLTPDMALPDLVLANRPKQALGGQAEFSKTPLEYLNVPFLLKLAAEGRQLAGTHASALDTIERTIGVDRNVLLAIWGRETAYGRAKLGHDVIRVLATQAWTGRRRTMFRAELLAALVMMEAGALDPKRHKASWAGAVGLVQFMPTEFDALAVDLDQDGKKDIYANVGDALASAANQLKAKGWTKGQPWGVEVKLPASLSCLQEGVAHAKPASEWLGAGVTLLGGAKIPTAHQTDRAFLLAPGGAHGPMFLVFENFLVLKRYNFADLYAVFVGHLADRIGGGSDFVTRWTTPALITNADIATLQGHLKTKGFPIDKVDGRAGMNTRVQIGIYQQQNGLAVDCWASAGVLAHLKKAAP